MKFDLIAWGADLTPERRAIWFQGRWYSYRDLDERATRLANHLASQGIGYGSRIGILASNHLAYFDLLFAAPKLGFILVPFSRRMTAEQLERAARLIQVDLVFHDARHASLSAETFRCQRASVEAMRGWMANARRERFMPPQLSPESAHLILFTSGTTDDPKAVLVPYRQTISNAQGTAMSLDLGPEDSTILATDCWHASISVLALPLLTIGGSVIVMSVFEPGEYLQLLQQYRASLCALLPGMYQMLISHPEFAGADLSSLRWAVCGGAPYDASVNKAFRDRGVPMVQGYGMTEAGSNCFAISTEEARERPDSVGRPMPHMLANVLDSHGQPCADNEVGDLVLAGDALCAGYFDNNAAWQAANRDGWFHTGDVAWRDEDGFYYVSGRRHDMFLSSGRAFQPSEVEQRIAELEDVQDCAVLGIPSVDRSQASTALAAIVLRPGAKRSAERIRTHLQPRLEPHKIPPVMLFVDALPRDDHGQVDRRALRRVLLPDA